MTMAACRAAYADAIRRQLAGEPTERIAAGQRTLLNSAFDALRRALAPGRTAGPGRAGAPGPAPAPR
jgi:hypothetical protein